MNTTLRAKIILWFAWLALFAGNLVAGPLGTAFTYQGRLDVGTSAANGSYDLKFTLYDDDTTGSVVGTPQTNLAVAISGGLFTVPLDFGSVFDGEARWLEMGVRSNGSGADFTVLSPRQELTPTPYALHATSAGSAGVAASVSTPPGMVLIPAGSFTIGNSIGDSDITDASPTDVTVSAFYMDVNEVTWSQWQSVYYWATNHGYGFVRSGEGKGANHPVHSVNWYDSVKWCNARSEQAGKTPVYYVDAGLTQVYRNGEPTAVYPNWAANGYRLPTEAEWEKAARGGLSGQRFPWGNVINQNLANYYAYPKPPNSGGYTYDLGPYTGYNTNNITGESPWTSPVGSFAVNGYGLKDMAGNVWEWCWDWYGTPYAGGSDPRGPASGSTRVLRGGNWCLYAINCRTADRDLENPSYTSYNPGFRCVRGL